MAESKHNERDAARRSAILQAARACFLQFGYVKTSLEDIAKRANVSRPLIYTKFKNKEEIFAAVFEDMIERRYPAATQALAGPGSQRDKLLRIYEILLVEPWEEMQDAPMAIEFYEACLQMFPQVEAKYEQHLLEYTQAILGGEEIAKVFMLAVDGFQSDIPSTAVLRRRLRLLVERFVP